MKERGGRGFRKGQTPPPVHRLANRILARARKTFGTSIHSGENSVAKNPTDKSSLSVVNYPSSIPKPPANLGPAGATLWRSIMSEFDISDAGGLALLEQIASAYDRAERLRIEIDRDGEIVHTRTGMREHPGLRAELASRSFVVRSLQRLGINLEAVRPGSGHRPKPAWADHGDQ
jgi:hypothetical protein